MTRYILVYITGTIDPASVILTPPGTMIEVDRFDTLEAANAEYKRLKALGQFIFLPCYEVEK